MQGRVGPVGEELPPPPPPPEQVEDADQRRRRAAEAPFVVGVVRAGVAPARRRRVPVRGIFADWGGTDEEPDTEGEELGVDFDDVSDGV